MPTMKGQLGGMDYPKDIPTDTHNICGIVKERTPMKGEPRDASQPSKDAMRELGSGSKLKGQLE